MSSLDYDQSSSTMNSDIVDNDVHVKLQELTEKAINIEKQKEAMEREKQELHDSYNKQRAQCQRLLLQKEDEAERLKNELEYAKAELAKVDEKDSKMKEQEEQIAVLSQLVEVTLDESQNEKKELQKKVHSLEEQLAKLMNDKSEGLLLAPSNMISATKNFAKMVVSQLGSETDRSESEDLEDSMRKAKEDADKLRSVVVPLEKEIDELKDRLKKAEERLKLYERGAGNSEMSEDDQQVLSSSTSCEMCHNYEKELQTQQLLTKQMQRERDVFQEDLAKETQFRKEMEEKWNEKKEEHKLQVSQLKREIVAGKREVEEIKLAFEAMCTEVRDNLKKLDCNRSEIEKEIEKVRRENDRLVGKYNKHSEQLRDENINLPNNVEELQLIHLKLQDELIASLVAKEEKEQAEATLQYEVDLLRTQIDALETDQLRAELIKQDKDRLEVQLHEKVKKLKQYKDEIESLTMQLKAANDENRNNAEAVQSLKAQVSSLQQQLDKSEQVQKDFVGLSQRLQVELENIRAAEKEVRWQFEQDVVDCHGCKQTFASEKKKLHCLHCGKIFCIACLDSVIASGPHQRKARICKVCHTLLNKESAPFFSRERSPTLH